MNYWLIKSELDCYSIDDLKRDKRTSWSGIRNYQARNFMRDHMKVGDLMLFYHSGTFKDPKTKETLPPHVAGVSKVASAAHPDLTALDKKDDHYDPKSSQENPIWMCVDVEFVEKFKNIVTLAQIKFDHKLKGIMVAAQGSRLSVQPVSTEHFKRIVELGK